MPSERVHSNPPHPQESARSLQRRRTEDRIITAAADLFLAAGYRATTIRRVAEAAGVSVGRVMAVGDKDALLVACYDRWIGQLQDGTAEVPATIARTGTTSAVQDHLLGIFLPFLEFFAAHEDLSRDYAAALIRIHGRPQVFDGLARDLQAALRDNLVSIGISEDNARASAAALYDSYMGVIFRWAASDMSAADAVTALADIIAFHTRFRRTP
ncbi:MULTISPECIES: TetR/AcrR family transcriptional regulator [unclassified Brevibacterium]|uniref:TetR/AcrR family transcriptional regulator n=1 Tax=unclassified Brevibacterium TaxID=2614124 RepID=UPI0010F59B51|nr:MULTISPECIES: TetR/AcrR family transcriptional regulator [unclassified Brevibacterium]MCM1012994.1 TetR/AcrR family transcriptional regulator [Brevibacterium sp. XM4083]